MKSNRIEPMNIPTHSEMKAHNEVLNILLDSIGSASHADYAKKVEARIEFFEVAFLMAFPDLDAKYEKVKERERE